MVGRDDLFRKDWWGDYAEVRGGMSVVTNEYFREDGADIGEIFRF